MTEVNALFYIHRRKIQRAGGRRKRVSACEKAVSVFVVGGTPPKFWAGYVGPVLPVAAFGRSADVIFLFKHSGATRETPEACGDANTASAQLWTRVSVCVLEPRACLHFSI